MSKGTARTTHNDHASAGIYAALLDDANRLADDVADAFDQDRGYLFAVAAPGRVGAPHIGRDYVDHFVRAQIVPPLAAEVLLKRGIDADVDYLPMPTGFDARGMWRFHPVTAHDDEGTEA